MFWWLPDAAGSECTWGTRGVCVQLGGSEVLSDPEVLLAPPRPGAREARAAVLASVATARMLAASGYVALGGSLLSCRTHARTGCRATVQGNFETQRMQLRR